MGSPAATAKTTIELNGKLYDARSGKVIGEAPFEARLVARRASSGTAIDGFVRRPTSHQSVAPALAPVRTKPNVARTAPAPTATKLEKSKTLMRPSVKKPKPVVKNDIAIIPSSQSLKKANPSRYHRAATIPKSSAIRRFTPATSHTIVKKTAAMPVVTPQTHHLTASVAQLATSTETQLRHSVDQIEASLRNASSHLEQFEGKVGRSTWQRLGFGNRAVSLASLSFAGLLLVGFFMYQNAPNLAMHMAAARSGVAAAQMPAYRPAGFSVSKNAVKSEPGKVTVAFHSNTDDKNYTISQQASNWSSDSLLSNHILPEQKPYQTYQDGGRTVFITDNSHATWVNGGVWYRIDGNASLTSDQLLRIASSF